jgi:DNA repair protein RecO (recombination protein O)
MQWTDQGILLSSRRYGETSAVVSLLTREHGRHAGLVKGGAGKRARGALQPGNTLSVVWTARLSEHLGTFSWELNGAPGAVWLDDPLRLAGLSAACAMADLTLPERQPHRATFEGLAELLAALGDDHWSSLYAHWELGLLGELGYSLDLERCAVTGGTGELAYVSPRSGRAVGRAAGEPYRDKLLVLPSFLRDRTMGDPAAVLAALGLTGYFLERHVLSPQGKSLPPARSRLVDRLKA